MIGQRRLREYRRITLLGLLLTGLAWLALTGVVVGLLVAAWPPVVVAGWAFTVAWLRGWPPRRLTVAALWCLPMLVTFAVAYWVAGDGTWQAAAWSPVLLRVARHEHVASLIVSMAGTVILWLSATTS
jgi:hypothetical protein